MMWPLQIDIELPDNIRILKRRPNLEVEIPEIIQCIEQRLRLPQTMSTDLDTGKLEAALAEEQTHRSNGSIS